MIIIHVRPALKVHNLQEAAAPLPILHRAQAEVLLQVHRAVIIQVAAAVHLQDHQAAVHQAVAADTAAVLHHQVVGHHLQAEDIAVNKLLYPLNVIYINLQTCYLILLTIS
jgi:hypothetical protein